jgi:hypothetical protein
MVLEVGNVLGLEFVTGKGTIHPSLQEINNENPNLDESPQKETRKRRG